MNEPGTTVEAPPVQPEVAGVPVVAPEPTPEQLAVEVQLPNGRTESRVPIAALHEERSKRQTAQREQQRLTETVQQLEARINEYDQYMRRAQPPAPVAPPPQPTAPDDAEALEFAQIMDMYRPDGQPDITRARRALAIAEKRAEAKINPTLEPLRQTAASSQAQILRQQAYAAKDKYGRSFASREAIDQVFGLVPDHLLTPDTARFLLLQAAGMENVGRAPQAAPFPAVTETSGGRVTGQPGGFTPAERHAMRHLGVSEAEFTKTTTVAPNATGSFDLE